MICDRQTNKKLSIPSYARFKGKLSTFSSIFQDKDVPRIDQNFGYAITTLRMSTSINYCVS